MRTVSVISSLEGARYTVKGCSLDVGRSWLEKWGMLNCEEMDEMKGWRAGELEKTARTLRVSSEQVTE